VVSYILATSLNKHPTVLKLEQIHYALRVEQKGSPYHFLGDIVHANMLPIGIPFYEHNSLIGA